MRAASSNIHACLGRALSVLILLLWPLGAAFADPLPSWNDTAPKQAIIEFVGRVTEEGSADFVPPAERIAVFDNDGTLWPEQPVYFQLQYAIDRISAQAYKHPEWKRTEPYKAIVEGDREALAAMGEKDVVALVSETHAGMTTDAFAANVDGWLKKAKHPRFERLYTDLAYQPMHELLRFLRDNGFKTFIVSGGGVEFMRRFAERMYSIPPEQVVGSSGVVKFRKGADGTITLMKEPEVEFVDDGPGKPVGINRFIGRKPIFAFGNSDGDLQMLEYTMAGKGPRFAGLVHHTDADREWAYDRESRIGKLDKALDEAVAKGWTVVDMKADWKVVFLDAKAGSE